ncbi:MAG: right-handed parallel beta-helix repeat-containing protein [Bacillota bacterium]
MIKCQNCGMNYDEEEYGFCPYCGHVPEEKPDGEEEILPAGKKSMQAGSAPDKPKKMANGKLKFVLLGLILVIAAAALVFAFFPFEESGVTVPDQYATIQEAIDAAEDGDEIVVQVGIHRENIDFRGKNIILKSTDPDNPEIVAETIIDGGGSGTVVSFRSGETEEAVLSGFTITGGSGILVSGGSSPRIENCTIEDNEAEYGAGIAVFDSSPYILNNEILNNSSFLGGGIFIEESSPLVEGNTISRNNAEMGSGVVIISNSEPKLIDNIISNNRATRLGGGLVVALGSTPTIKDNTISGNAAERNGGGLLIEESEPVIEDNMITQNRAANGGGIFVVNSMETALFITGNNINGNLAYIAGGGLYMEGSSPTLDSNTFSDNISEHLGGAAAIYNSTPVFLRNIFENNQAGDPDGGGAVWVSADSVLELNDPDDNTYTMNLPNDLFSE